MTGETAEPRTRRFRWETITGSQALLQENSFRQLWLGRIVSHTALNAVLYTLLVLAVGDAGGGSSIKAALFITAYLLPTATLGTISGVIVDRLPKNLVLFLLNIGRVGLMILLLMSNTSLWVIYVVAMLTAITSQFATPAEAAAVPQVVRRDQLTSANSLNNLGALVSQVVGFAVLPPLLLNTVGPKPLFFIAAILFGAGAAVFLGIRELGSRQIDIDRTVDAVREVRKQFAQAWDTLKRDLLAYMSVVIVVLASTASLVAVTLMPRYTESVLDIKVQNAIFVFLPAALGILAGLRLVQVLDRRMSGGWLVGGGFVLLVAALFCLALVRPFAGQVEAFNLFGLFDPGPFGDTTARIVVTILFSTVAAFAFAVVGVSSRSLVNQRMPLEIQGRVFAAQTVLTNLASIPPILLAGVLGVVFGVVWVLGLTALILIGVAAWALATAVARPAAPEGSGAG